MQALLGSLLVVIGVAAPDLARAEAAIDALPTELKPLLRQEWVNYRLHRASMAGGGEIKLDQTTQPDPI
jgi:hypothetical protein